MLLYLCPAIMDWLLFFVLTAVMYSVGEEKAGVGACCILGIIYQVAYMGCSVLAGKFLNRKNAKSVLVFSTIFAGMTGALCLWFKSLILLGALLGFFGLFAALFFNAFQSFMRGESPPGTLKKTVALYSLSWSLGAAAGCMTAGLIYRLGFTCMFASIFFCMGAVLFFLLSHKGRGHTEISAEEHIEHGSEKAHPVSPAYVLVGWIMIFTIVFVQRPVTTFLPNDFGSRGVSPFLASLPLFGHMFVQGVAGWLMWRFRDYLYRKTPFLIIHALAAVGFLLMWLLPYYPVCLLGLTLLGVYAGFAYFCAVYYASNSERKTFNVGLNEALVGLGSIAGILAGYYWTRTNAAVSDLYLMCGLALVLAAAFQSITTLTPKKASTQSLE